MDKQIVEEVMERSQGLCEVCYAPGVHLHHIIKGRGKRKEHESSLSVILLCYNCHMGTNGVHGKNGRELDLRLKRELQEKYKELGYTEEEVREKMGGRLY